MFGSEVTRESSPEGLLADTAREVVQCRACESALLEPYLDLGHMPPADQFPRPDQLRKPILHFPLVVLLCTECGLSQLSCVVDPRILYQDDYPYESSTTRAGRSHFRAFAASVSERFAVKGDDLVVDIGSNVGVLLSGFRDEGARVLGIDPAENIAAIANASGIKTHATFFGREIAEEIVRTDGQAKVVTGTNVFAHVDDLVGFIDAANVLLADRGVLILEAPLFGNLVEQLEYDTIYHEHLSYISITPLKRFFERFGMRIFDVCEVDLHGGSIRIFVDRGRNPVNEVVLDAVLAHERAIGALDLYRLREFADAVAAHRRMLTELLYSLRAERARIAGVSAPAKGSTLLNYCRLGPETIEYVTEKTTLKIGRYTPGTHIPVVADDHLLADRPDYALLLAWNFAEEIMTNLSQYADGGGKFILPIPEPRIVRGPSRLASTKART
jgi:SAM-dependent methyltransferase